MIVQASIKTGIYYYMFPTFAQGRKVIWEGKDNEGRPFIDYIPKDLLDGKPKEDDMQLRLKTDLNGQMSFSIIQIVGSDNYNHLLGTNPSGIVLSEYSLQDPTAYEFFRPMLRANGGWAVFNYLPRGKNHGHKLLEVAKYNVSVLKSPDWYWQSFTVDDTFTLDDNGNKIPIISKEDIQKERDEGMAEELIQQEYYCSFEFGAVGNYYADLVEKAEEEKRIRDIPWEPKLPVYTYWDLGVSDSTSIAFVQHQEGLPCIIDHYRSHGKGILEYIKYCREKPYVYARHTGPHDLERSEMGTGTSILEAARSHGFSFDICPNLSIQDGINASRMMLMTCCFDRKKTQGLIDSLKEYHKVWDPKRKEFLSKPYHNWASHDSDMFRYFSISNRRERINVRNSKDRYAESDFDPMNYEEDQMSYKER